MPALIAIVIAVVLGGSPAEAHGSDIHLLRPVWTFDPWIVTPLCLAGALYGLGFGKLWRRGRGGWKILLRRAAAYGMGWLTLAAALVSPLHWLGERLFTFHMIEHEILMAISAPAIVLARPIGVLLWGLPPRLRRMTARGLKIRPVQLSWEWTSRGMIATCVHAVAIWVWHAPVLFDAAVTDVRLHRLQHLSFFATAVLFWWSVLWRSERGVAAWHVFLTMLHTSILGALMALAPHVLYGVQTRAAEMWGLTPLEDQQLAGMVMWIPAGTVYAGAALTLFGLWIASSSKGVRHVVGPDIL
jgi:cytochrome c oxidase assembly factor CtaG